MGISKLASKFVSFDMIMFGLHKHLIITRARFPEFARKMAERDLVAQVMIHQEKSGYWFEFRGGKVRLSKGVHERPDVTLGFRDRRTARDLLIPPFDWSEQIHAQKMFRLTMDGRPDDTAWFQRLLIRSTTIGERYGQNRPGGEVRYVNNNNGGPVFVDVKDGRIVRMTPVVLRDDDAKSWTITARGRKFTPPRRAAIASHALCMKSRVYSEDRIMYPMKRVDFDPHGERNAGNRGVSGHERISWDEALDIVAGEIVRCRTQSGPGSIGTLISAHHLWGNVGYHLSAAHRFWNLIGHTYIAPSVLNERTNNL